MQCKLALRLQKERAKGTFFFTAVCARPFCKGKTTQCSSVFCVNRPLFVTGLFALKKVVVRGTKFDGFSFLRCRLGRLRQIFVFLMMLFTVACRQCFAKHCCFLPFCGKIKKSYNMRVRQFLRMLLQRKKASHNCSNRNVKCSNMQAVQAFVVFPRM